MKNYLICKLQDVTDVNGIVLGKRICDVADTTFPVSNDYEWKQYSDFVDIYTGDWYWTDKPVSYVPPPSLDDIKRRADQLLQETDWTAIDSIADPALSDPHLVNQAAFIEWRSQIRVIALNPVVGVVFPEKPQEQWSS